MRSVRALLIVVGLVILIKPSQGRILNVPGEYETIESAFERITDGDTILVQRGVYQVHLEVENRSFMLAGTYLMDQNQESIESTIIRGRGNSSALRTQSLSRGRVTVIGLTFQDNEGMNGGAIDVSGGRYLQVEKVNFISNHATMYGGGAGIQFCDTVIFRDVLFQGNTCSHAGGGITLKNINFARLERVISIGNSSSAAGGGVHIGESNVTIEDLFISGNESRYGGGIYIDLQSNVQILNSEVILNHAAMDGGGIMHDDQGSISMDNVLIASNSANERGGGFIGLGAEISASRLTLIGNTAETGQSMRIDLGADFSISNSIVRETGENIILCEAGGMQNSLTFSYCNLTGGREAIITNDNADVFWLEGNIDTAPLFLDADNGDYSLSPDSPCIDAGDPDAPLDPDGTRADMGAFYFHQRDIAVEQRELHFPPGNWGELDSLAVEIRNEGGTLLHISSILPSNDMSCVYFRPEGQFDPPLELEPDSALTLWFYILPDSDAGFEKTAGIFSDDPDEPEITIHAEGEWPNSASDPTFSPFTFHISPPYPNPFNATTLIRFSTGSQAAPTRRLAVYDLSGREVARLLDSQLLSHSGTQSLVWNAEDLPGGIYFIRLEAGSEVRTVKAVLLR